MLHRAFIYVPSAVSSIPINELTVFFECQQGAVPDFRLRTLIANVWCTQPALVDYYNLFDEPVMRQNANHPVVGAGPEHDAVLLEMGWTRGGTQYCRSKSTQFLVGPRWQRRLMAAQVYVEAQETARLHYADERLLNAQLSFLSSTRRQSATPL
jgi:hypothetical protein